VVFVLLDLKKGIPREARKQSKWSRNLAVKSATGYSGLVKSVGATTVAAGRLLAKRGLDGFFHSVFPFQ
jgi:hypothetical protein